ncbi:hypothetical protein K0M31_010485 [Melipona bicolor]|uniref:Uncharacterized protein n=1 Tax=Melipona bicolor TaxID=60889 RepID=A0AA40KIA4_9HYME|nr:hypothetical protein K0M31_010485 [Melipona bicolor]
MSSDIYKPERENEQRRKKKPPSVINYLAKSVDNAKELSSEDTDDPHVTSLASLVAMTNDLCDIQRVKQNTSFKYIVYSLSAPVLMVFIQSAIHQDTAFPTIEFQSLYHFPLYQLSPCSNLCVKFPVLKYNPLARNNTSTSTNANDLEIDTTCAYRIVFGCTEWNVGYSNIDYPDVELLIPNRPHTVM